MCRFALYLGHEITLGSLVTEPESSIIHQSYHSHEREEPLNGDGFGVAWYPPGRGEPALFKDVSPAWNNMNLLHLAPVVSSSCILAHIRAASPGLPVTQLNCHPFTCGPYAFMHNGDVGGFKSWRRRLLEGLTDEGFASIQGSTDSEQVFAVAMDSLRRQDAEPATADTAPRERMATALLEAIRRVEELRAAAGVEETSCTLNLVLTDGIEAVVTRYVAADARANSLYVHTGKRYVCEDGMCRMLEHETSRGAVLVASEPLSPDPGWESVPSNHLLLIDAELGVETREIQTRTILARPSASSRQATA